MTPNPRGLVAPLLMAVLSGTTDVTASGQRVYAYSEPAACTTFYKPIEGVTHHSGGEFNISWFIMSPQYGPVTYQGEPSPAYSTNRKLIWTNPTSNVTCFIDWYYLLPGNSMDAFFRWHINFYGGTVSTCTSGGGGGPFTVLDDAYDPYDPAYFQDPSSAPACGGGTGTGGGTQYSPGDHTGGETVDWNTGIGTGFPSDCGPLAIVDYVCIDLWKDGVGWVTWGCGYITRCG